MNDVDVKAQLTREKFEELAQSILARALEPAKSALAESGASPCLLTSACTPHPACGVRRACADRRHASAGLSVEDISFVEVVGGCSRAPAMCKALEGFFGKQLSRTMNASEAVARGCALQARTTGTPSPLHLPWCPALPGLASEASLPCHCRGQCCRPRST